MTLMTTGVFMSVMKMNNASATTMLDHGRLLQTLSPALSDTDRFGLPVDAPQAQWVSHIVQIGTCKNELNATRYLNLYLEHSNCGAVWFPAPLGKDEANTSEYFAQVDDQSLDGTAHGIVYKPSARFSRVRIKFVGEYEHPIPLSALALIGPPSI